MENEKSITLSAAELKRLCKMSYYLGTVIMEPNKKRLDKEENLYFEEWYKDNPEADPSKYISHMDQLGFGHIK